MTRVHVIGAGLAGLATAVSLTTAGHEVILYEAAPYAGGRARSWDDPVLGVQIDNGNHLMLGANGAIQHYIALIGADDQLCLGDHARYDFVDLTDGRQWQIDFGDGHWPGWIFQPSKRPPGWQPIEFLAEMMSVILGKSSTLGPILTQQGPHYRSFWQPFCQAVLNMDVENADRALLARVLAELVLKGGKAMRPMTPRHGLGDLLVVPALIWLQAHSARWHPSSRLTAIEADSGWIKALCFGDRTVVTGRDERIVLAVPWHRAARLLHQPVWQMPGAGILNAHFCWPGPETSQITGMIGGVSQWLFRRQHTAGVTISAACRLFDKPAEDMLGIIWQEIAPLVGGKADQPPPGRVIKEKNATFRADPDRIKCRPVPGLVAGYDNLLLAGDWTQTGLPATIEGAVRSGFQVASMING